MKPPKQSIEDNNPNVKTKKIHTNYMFPEELLERHLSLVKFDLPFSCALGEHFLKACLTHGFSGITGFLARNICNENYIRSPNF